MLDLIKNPVTPCIEESALNTHSLPDIFASERDYIERFQKV